jgi:hypothetical protein
MLILMRELMIESNELKSRELELKGILNFKDKGELLHPEPVDYSILERPILLCGYLENREAVIEIIPYNRLRIWYLRDEKIAQASVPNEEWNYLLRDGHLLSENSLIEKAYFFQSSKDLYIIGANQFLSTYRCHDK